MTPGRWYSLRLWRMGSVLEAALLITCLLLLNRVRWLQTSGRTLVLSTDCAITRRARLFFLLFNAMRCICYGAAPSFSGVLIVLSPRVYLLWLVWRLLFYENGRGRHRRGQMSAFAVRVRAIRNRIVHSLYGERNKAKALGLLRCALAECYNERMLLRQLEEDDVNEVCGPQAKDGEEDCSYYHKRKARRSIWGGANSSFASSLSSLSSSLLSSSTAKLNSSSSWRSPHPDTILQRFYGYRAIYDAQQASIHMGERVVERLKKDRNAAGNPISGRGNAAPPSASLAPPSLLNRVADTAEALLSSISFAKRSIPLLWWHRPHSSSASSSWLSISSEDSYYLTSLVLPQSALEAMVNFHTFLCTRLGQAYHHACERYFNNYYQQGLLERNRSSRTTQNEPIGKDRTLWDLIRKQSLNCPDNVPSIDFQSLLPCTSIFDARPLSPSTSPLLLAALEEVWRASGITTSPFAPTGTQWHSLGFRTMNPLREIHDLLLKQMEGNGVAASSTSAVSNAAHEHLRGVDPSRPVLRVFDPSQRMVIAMSDLAWFMRSFPALHRDIMRYEERMLRGNLELRVRLGGGVEANRNRTKGDQAFIDSDADSKTAPQRSEPIIDLFSEVEASLYISSLIRRIPLPFRCRGLMGAGGEAAVGGGDPFRGGRRHDPFSFVCERRRAHAKCHGNDGLASQTHSSSSW